ncbi:enoyl-CoA hydratase/isomerase [Trichodelitschia bisporula]|uniref:Enoyl-CoA hydratase/isomerase n=1 Tax=Trichodelitschia bisporula TaxID=703511 RepID=A0A6G1I7T2_9PEZI|nr:enoyl-CoA hydratase/isomerase [Trichodelitschia bisporula]
MSTETFDYKYFNVTFPAEHVAVVEINRPEKLNAFVEEMWHNLSKIITRLSLSPTIRSILLTGAGRAFTAGLDVQAASQGPTLNTGASANSDPARLALHHKAHILDFQACITSIERCAKPVIVLLHGISYGLAIDISVACDVRLATADARLCIKEVDIGIAADIGTLTRLPKAGVSMSWVKEVALTAREFGAEEALRVGLVSAVLPDKTKGIEAALDICRTIASKSPIATLGTKELINYSRDHTVEEGLNYTAVWNAAMLQTGDVKSALLSGLQRRKPTFEKL